MGLDDRRARVRSALRPIREFIETEAASGAVLLAAALLALIWANSTFSDTYEGLLETHLVLDLGILTVDETLHFWVNEVAMVLFFFVVGMEIKREIVLGELSGVRRLMVPFGAAVGGMLVPIAIFLLVAGGADARAGWGVPMATDIAFALGLMALLGSRVPAQLKVLLLAIAIFDDLGAVFVIALFYSEQVAWLPVLIGVGLLCLAPVLWRLGVHRVPVFAAIAIAAWAAAIESGIHPTVVGVAMGLMTPWRPVQSPDRFPESAKQLVGRFEQAPGDGALNREHRRDAVVRLRDLSWRALAPLDRLEHELHSWIAFVVVPVFAWANAGVDLRGGVLDDALSSSLTWAIVFGFVVGKPIGLLLGFRITERLGGRVPHGVGTWNLLAIGLLAGVGFTVALFVTDLAYMDHVLVEEAKVGILIASSFAGILGLVTLALTTRRSSPAS